MKIGLITTLPGLIEIKRIEEEVKKRGDSFQLIDLSGFGYLINNKTPQIFGLEESGDLDLVIVRGIFNAIKPISTYVNHLRTHGVKIFDNNLLATKSSIDKVSDILKLSLAGVSVPPTLYCRSSTDLKLKADNIGFPLVIKSTRSGKGANIFKTDNKAELKDIINELESTGKNTKSYLVQKFIDYKYDLRCLVIGEQVFTMRRIPPKGDFRANYSIGGTVENFEIDESTKELVERAIKAVDLEVGGVDVLIDQKGQKYILEVNHTAGFVGMEQALKKNIGEIYLEHAIVNAK